MINDPTLPETDAPLEMLEGAGNDDPPTPPEDGAGSGGRPGDGYDGPKIEISEEMRNSYLGYAMSTIVSRALPDVRDGLKPVQRRILYSMRDLNLTPNNRHLKSAKIVGECIGNYHPHGDQAIYLTMVRMAQPFSLRYPLVDGQGNFGCFTGDTRIKLMDGTEKSFEELAALGSSARFYVYAVDADGRIVPGAGRNSRITRRDAELVEVTLDNGKKIRCTPDHRFLLRDGKTYKEAQSLTPNDSLMPGPEESAVAGKALDDCLYALSVRPLTETADVYDITVDEHHNFLLADGVFVHNSIDDDPPAAYRYTEARMTPLAVEMLEDIEKNTVDFEPTFDNERMQPTVLPGKFPNLICNGGSGIAVAMANNMPPHNLTEVCDAVLHLLERPDATVEQLMQFIPGPDFPTAGLILGSKGIKAAYETGRGSVTMQAKTSIEPMDGGKNAIIVTELPYQVIKKKLIEDMAELVKDKKVDGITAINDFSDRNGMRMVIELRRDVIPQKVLNYLLKHTNLRLNFGVIMLSLVDNGRGPRTLSLKGILQEYIDHRRIVLTRRTRYELNRAKARAHILEGLQIAVQFLDEVIQIIRASASTEQARTRLIERFIFSGLQVEAILNMQLRQLTALEQDKIEGEYRDLLKEVGRLEDILSDPRRLDALVKADLKYLKDKFGDERRTQIFPSEADEISIEDLIANEEMLLTVTRDGYIKRMAMDQFPSQHRGGKGRIAGKTKEEDNIEHIFRASTHDYILFFTDRGRVYRLKAYDVPQTSRTAMGTAIVNLIQIQSDERITATIPIRDLRAAEGYLLMVTERGEVKRTKITEYANLRANGLITFDLEPSDRLGWVKHTDGTMKVILTSVRGMAIQFHEEDVPSRGRAAGGVRGMTLDGAKDRIVTADLVPEKSELLVVSENGYGKRTPMTEYRLQSRGGKGIKTMDITDKTGSLIQACVLESAKIGDLRLVIVTEQGIGIRMKVAEVRQTTTRSTQGVKLIELSESDRVKSAEYLDATKKAEDEAAE